MKFGNFVEFCLSPTLMVKEVKMMKKILEAKKAISTHAGVFNTLGALHAMPFCFIPFNLINE